MPMAISSAAVFTCTFNKYGFVCERLFFCQRRLKTFHIFLCDNCAALPIKRLNRNDEKLKWSQREIAWNVCFFNEWLCIPFVVFFFFSLFCYRNFLLVKELKCPLDAWLRQPVISFLGRLSSWLFIVTKLKLRSHRCDKTFEFRKPFS